MESFNEPLDNLEECFCSLCRNIWWVPYYEELVEMGHPSYCPFCGAEFEETWELDEEG